MYIFILVMLILLITVKNLTLKFEELLNLVLWRLLVPTENHSSMFANLHVIRLRKM